MRNGTTQVEQAGGTIQALVVDVQRVSALMNQIAEASAEQSRGVSQVNKTVTQMDKVVQENASAVQQSAAAAQGMRHQAEMLVEAVSAFTLDGSHAAPAARPERGDFARRFPPRARPRGTRGDDRQDRRRQGRAPAQARRHGLYRAATVTRSGSSGHLMTVKFAQVKHC